MSEHKAVRTSYRSPIMRMLSAMLACTLIISTMALGFEPMV